MHLCRTSNMCGPTRAYSRRVMYLRGMFMPYSPEYAHCWESSNNIVRGVLYLLPRVESIVFTYEADAKTLCLLDTYRAHAEGLQRDNCVPVFPRHPTCL